MSRLLFALLGCVAGCVVQPHAGTQTAKPAAPLPGFDPSPRVGVEFLAPEAAFSDAGDLGQDAGREVWVEPLRDGEDRWRQPPSSPPRRNERKHTWLMDADDLAAVEDLEVQLTLRFLDNVMGEDRRRVYRELGRPILQPQMVDLQSSGIELPSETAQREEAEEWLAEHGSRMLNRPLRRLLRQTPLVQQFEVELDDFKSDHVPLSEAYREVHDDQRYLGRVSVRMHLSDLQDPLEVVYIRGGVRVGTSQHRLKLGYATDLAEHVRLEVHSRQDYQSHAWSVRADVVWVFDQNNSLHFVVGDDLDFLSTSAVYSMLDTPLDGSPGCMIYALHLF